MKRKHKRYSRPKKLYDKQRIEEEAGIKKEFGLKNKREIWKAEAGIKRIRERAKKAILLSKEEQKSLFERLEKIGLKVNSISEILSLEKRDFLNRRLQTVLSRKLKVPIKKARQLIVHKKIFVGTGVINSPSYIVPVDMEDKISFKEIKVMREKNDGKS